MNKAVDEAQLAHDRRRESEWVEVWLSRALVGHANADETK